MALNLHPRIVRRPLGQDGEVQVRPVGRMGRRIRAPKHQWYVKQRPFELTPLCVAPVLPGETLKNFNWQARVLSDPLASQIIGWWCEYYWFYVKISDLDGRDDFQAAMVDPSTDLDEYRASSTAPWLYEADGLVRWAFNGLKRITEEYFRDEGEAWDAYVGDAGHPLARVVQENWMDSLIPASELQSYDETILDAATTDTLEISEVDAALRRYEFLRLNGMVDMSYEDWLATYGVRVPEVQLHRPELLRYTRQWAYPSSAVDGDGSTSTVVSFAIQERGDKDRFFREPGFIIGCGLIRAKTYNSLQVGSAIGHMENGLSWLPAIMNDDPASSIQPNAAGDGVLASSSVDYAWDLRDLLLYGDQFVNVALDGDDHHLMVLPSTDITNTKYPTSAQIDKLFAGEAPANKITQDGVCQFHIASTEATDYTV